MSNSYWDHFDPKFGNKEFDKNIRGIHTVAIAAMIVFYGSLLGFSGWVVYKLLDHFGVL